MLFLLLRFAMIRFFFIVFFSASLCRRVNVKVRPPPAWENWISAFSSYSLVLEFSPKKPTRSLTGAITPRAVAPLFMVKLSCSWWWVFFRASVSRKSRVREGNVRRLIGRFFLFRVLTLNPKPSFLSLSRANFWLRVIFIRRRLRRVRGTYCERFFCAL